MAPVQVINYMKATLATIFLLIRYYFVALLSLTTSLALPTVIPALGRGGKIGQSRVVTLPCLKLVPLQFFTNDFGIKRGSFEDEDINEGTTQNSEQSFLGFNQNSGLSR